MKITDQDIELANRFPTETSDWGFGKVAADAKVSPQQLQRLLKLGLIKPTERSRQWGGFAGSDGAKKYGAGHMGRHCTDFVRVK